MSDNSYKKLLVLGSKKVGKTSLLSAVTSREFDDEYYKTKRVVSFWDVKRRLEFIDVPGLDDKILELMDDDKSSNSTPLIDDDPQIKSFFKEEDGQDLASISGYIIMYSNEDTVTQRMAFELLRVVTQVYERKDKPIWIVENEGSIHRVQQIPKGLQYHKDFEDIAKKWGANFMEVNVKTNKNVEKLMDNISKALGSHVKLEDLFPQTSKSVGAGSKRVQCEVPTCNVM
mmetsp:Transcript_5798/g.10653  ORF Transcript_5798/g.10653 Transcript_5798/m.10653 type:complete len:229 (-) Transcript_5798:128-814(-)